MIGCAITMIKEQEKNAMDMKVESTTIAIDGLKRNYVFYQISDAHVVYAGDNDSEQEREYAAQRTEHWSRLGRTPRECLESAITYVNEQESDGLIITGDCIDYYSDSIAGYMSEVLGRCNKEVFYTCGNHEKHLYPYDDGEACFREAFAPMMRGNTLQWSQEFDDFILVGINDSTREVSDAQIEYLKAQAEKGKPIVLVMHIPVYTQGLDAPLRKKWGDKDKSIIYFTIGNLGTTEQGYKFYEYINREDNGIAVIFTGHVHFASVTEFSGGRELYTCAPTYKRYIRRIELVAR